MQIGTGCAIIIKLSVRKSSVQYAAVAQLDRVFGYEPKGRGFESLQPYQKKRCNFNSYSAFSFSPDDRERMVESKKRTDLNSEVDSVGNTRRKSAINGEYQGE